jgi:hypothetical protein
LITSFILSPEAARKQRAAFLFGAHLAPASAAIPLLDVQFEDVPWRFGGASHRHGRQRNAGRKHRDSTDQKDGDRLIYTTKPQPFSADGKLSVITLVWEKLK